MVSIFYGKQMSLLVQQFLENHSFQELQEQHGVYASFSKSPYKWSLNYDMIEAKENDPLANQCRGLILATPNGQPLVGHATMNGGKINYENVCPGETIVLGRAMDRFFNYGQGNCATINWSDPKLAVLEKLDGSLCLVYYDWFTKEWCVATRSVPEADLLMDNGIFTFRTLFEKALKETCGLDFSDFTYKLNRNITYCFELTTPYNRIVVNYPESRVTLLAARSLCGNMEEFDFTYLGGKSWMDYKNLSDKVKQALADMGHDEKDAPEAFVDKPFNLYGVPVVKSYTYNSVEELVNWVSSLNPLEHEGVVVRDSNFNRIKVKNAQYVAYNKIRDRLGTSERNIVELILAEKDDDVIPMLPEEIVKNLQSIKEGIRKVIEIHDETYKMIKLVADAAQLGDKKTFALLVQKTVKMAEEKKKPIWQAPFFQMFDNKVNNMKDFIAKNRKDGSWGDSFLDKILDLAKKA
jgi:hypothetical protein